MTSTTLPGGTFQLADDLILTRMIYGAMQLAGLVARCGGVVLADARWAEKAGRTDFRARFFQPTLRG